ncbi:hypothetical protein Anas_08613, partial [Armadillidium nasatum]
MGDLNIFCKYHTTLSCKLETMLRSLQNNLTHENDFQSLKPTYQTQHELTNILDKAITDSIGTSAK